MHFKENIIKKMSFISFKNFTLILVLITSFVISYNNDLCASAIFFVMFVTYHVTKFLIICVNFVFEDCLLSDYKRTIDNALKYGNTYDFELVLSKKKKAIDYDKPIPLFYKIISTVHTKPEFKIPMLKILLKYDKNMSKFDNPKILDHVDISDYETLKFIIEDLPLDKSLIKSLYQKVFDKISNDEFSYLPKYFESCKLLIECGFDAEYLSENKENLLMLVCKEISSKDFFDFVLKLNFDVNIKDKFGFTALYYACLTNKLYFVKKLIEKECNVNSVDNNKKTILDWTSVNNFEIEQLLLHHGAKHYDEL